MITNWLAWYNLIFILPMALALIFLGLSIFGGLGDSDVDVDSDVDLDGDVDAGNISTDKLPHDIDYDSPSFLSTMLSALGIGKVPLSILMFCWLMIFGFIGLLINSLWWGFTVHILVIISASIAFFVSLFLTAFIARGIAKVMPQTESYAEKRKDYINREAEARFQITATSGTITLYDKFSNLQTFSAIKDSSCKENIPSGQKVIIVSYSSQEGVFVVIPAQINN